jgi:hypothetical protein
VSTNNSNYANNDPRALMAQSIMRPLVGDSINSDWTDGTKMEAFASSFIKPNSLLTSMHRLEIYNQQYWYRLIDSLREDFPGLLAVLGEERFSHLVEAYLTKYPSQSFTLRNLGERLARFVRDDTEFFKKPDKKLILDLVTFDWSESQAFDAEEKPPLKFCTSADLLTIDSRFQLQPYVFVLSLTYEVDKFLLRRRRLSEGRTVINVRRVSAKTLDSQLRKPKKRKTFVVIHRQNNTVFYKRINMVEYKVLSAIKRGASLVECFSSVKPKDLQSAYSPRKAINSLRDRFYAWARLGWFCAFSSDT